MSTDACFPEAASVPAGLARYALTVAYDGTDFCGWQRQIPHADSVPAGLALGDEANAEAGAELVLTTGSPDEADPPRGALDRPRIELRTVQAVVERAVRAVVRERVIVMGASRTDSGVHAKGQVAAFTCSAGEGASRGAGWPMGRGVEPLGRAINSRLPADVRVLRVETAAPGFNPIQGARRKAYSYTIYNARQRPLWQRRTALHVWDELDVDRMNEAAGIMQGEHDFAAFAAAGHGRLSTVRTVFICRVESEAIPDEQARRIVIWVEGSGFLWNMVRIIAGTLVEAGRGRMPMDRIRDALESGRRDRAGPTLRPHGLCLEWIRYA